MQFNFPLQQIESPPAGDCAKIDLPQQPTPSSGSDPNWIDQSANYQHPRVEMRATPDIGFIVEIRKVTCRYNWTTSVAIAKEPPWRQTTRVPDQLGNKSEAK